MATDSLQLASHVASLFARFLLSFQLLLFTDCAYRHWRMSCTRRGGEDRTLRRTHIFLSLVSVAHTCAPLTFTRTCVWLKAQGSRLDWDVSHICAPQKSSTLTACFTHRASTCLTHFPSFWSTPPPSTPNSLLMTGIRRPPGATPPGGLLCGRLAESTPLTGYEPKTCIDLSIEHTPINYPTGETASTSRTTTKAPQSQPPRAPTVFHQQAAASGGPQQVPASVVNPWLSADTWSSTRKLVRGTESIASVEGTLWRGKRDRHLESAKTPSGRRNLHVHLEQKAEKAVQRECAAEKKTI